jgi:hypothetical protein
MEFVTYNKDKPIYNFKISKTPTKNKKNFGNYAKVKACKKLVVAVRKVANQYRLGIFENILKTGKVSFFINVVTKALKESQAKKNAFYKMIPAQSALELGMDSINCYDIEILVNFFNCLDKLVMKSVTNSYWKLYYSNKNTDSDVKSSGSYNISLIEAFYKRQIRDSLTKLDRKLNIKQKINKDRAYLKIIAYSKYLKHLSPYKPRSIPTSPEKSFYSASSLSKNSKLTPSLTCQDYNIYKIATFISQNHFMCTAVSFKHWKIQIILEDF